MNSNFLFRLSILLTSVSGFTPVTHHNARILKSDVTLPHTTAPVSEFRSKVSLSAIVEAGMDPVFTSIILGAALAGSFALNPDEENETISNSAKSLVAEAPPVEEQLKKETSTMSAPPTKKIEVKEAPEETKTETITPESKLSETTKAAAVSPKEDTAEKVSSESKVSEASKANPVATKKAVSPAAPTAVKPAAISVPEETTPNVPKKEASKEVMADGVDDLVKELAASSDKAVGSKFCRPNSVSTSSENEGAPTSPNESIEAKKEKLEKLVKESHPSALSPFSIEESITIDESPQQTPFVTKMVVKVLMPWRKFSNI